jgi:hypothetical protein
MNGVVTRPGSVLVVRQKGIRAIPARQRGVLLVNAVENRCNGVENRRCLKSFIIPVSDFPNGSAVYSGTARQLQIGEKVYLIGITVRSDEIAFSLQPCSTSSPTPPYPKRDVPYRSALAFRFPKGHLATAGYNEVQELIEWAVSIDNSGAAEPVEQLSFRVRGDRRNRDSLTGFQCVGVAAIQKIQK